MSALPGIGTPHRVPPERKHNRLWRERRERLLGLIQHIPQKKILKNKSNNVNKSSIHDPTVRLDYPSMCGGFSFSANTVRALLAKYYNIK